jgi:hypothetical protein
MTRKTLLLALAAAAALGLTGCRLHPSSPGFLPDGSSVWILDVDRDDNGDGVTDRTVRTWMYWCHGTPEAPQPCGTERQWAWGELGTVAP